MEELEVLPHFFRLHIPPYCQLFKVFFPSGVPLAPYKIISKKAKINFVHVFFEYNTNLFLSTNKFELALLSVHTDWSTEALVYEKQRCFYFSNNLTDLDLF